MYKKSKKFICMASAILGILIAAPHAKASEENHDKLNMHVLGAKPLPNNVILSLAPSYTVPGKASLNFTVPHVENSCARIFDRDVTLKENKNILDVEFSSAAITTFKLKDKKGNDKCGQHSFAHYTLPLDFELLTKKGVSQIRIWNQFASDSFSFESLGENRYEINPVTSGRYFKIKNHEGKLEYTQYPQKAFRVYPDLTPSDETQLLRHMRNIARERGYDLFDYKVRYDKNDRPYYILIDQRGFIIQRLVREAYIKFDEIEVVEQGQRLPMRIYAGRI